MTINSYKKLLAITLCLLALCGLLYPQTPRHAKGKIEQKWVFPAGSDFSIVKVETIFNEILEIIDEYSYGETVANSAKPVSVMANKNMEYGKWLANEKRGKGAYRYMYEKSEIVAGSEHESIEEYVAQYTGGSGLDSARCIAQIKRIYPEIVIMGADESTSHMDIMTAYGLFQCCGCKHGEMASCECGHKGECYGFYVYFDKGK